MRFGSGIRRVDSTASSKRLFRGSAIDHHLPEINSTTSVYRPTSSLLVTHDASSERSSLGQVLLIWQSGDSKFPISLADELPPYGVAISPTSAGAIYSSYFDDAFAFPHFASGLGTPPSLLLALGTIPDASAHALTISVMGTYSNFFTASGGTSPYEFASHLSSTGYSKCFDILSYTECAARPSSEILADINFSQFSSIDGLQLSPPYSNATRRTTGRAVPTVATTRALPRLEWDLQYITRTYSTSTNDERSISGQTWDHARTSSILIFFLSASVVISKCGCRFRFMEFKMP